MVAGPIIIPMMVRIALSFLSVRALVEKRNRSVARKPQSPGAQMTPRSAFSSGTAGEILALFLRIYKKPTAPMTTSAAITPISR